MANSMTGYGRAEKIQGERKFTVELKSVNNRYLDLNIRLPRQFNPFEAKIREELKCYMERGKVDVFISYEDTENAGTSVRYNKKLAAEYLQHIREIADDFGLEDKVSAAKLSAYPDVFTTEEETEDVTPLWESLQETIREAARQFAAARAKEGEFLKNDLLQKLEEMEQGVNFLSERAPKIISEYQRQLSEKVRAMLQDTAIDEGRILQEVAIYSDKVCIDEELTRLRSHIAATRQELQSEGSIGRKLDFLAQELNREANTILSKTTDVESSNTAIAIKTEIEKIREQIQNLE